jgi:hypothetical protein
MCRHDSFAGTKKGTVVSMQNDDEIQWTPDDTWARRKLRALLKRLMERLADEHQRAADELRRAAK